MIKLIALVDAEFGISKKGEIPWRFREDIDLFYQKTKNKVVVMGKSTFFSIPGGSLKNRVNCVISTTLNSSDKIRVFRSFEDFILEYEDDFWIIGGAHLYNYALKANLVDYALITQVHKNHCADKFIDTSYLGKFSKKIFFRGHGYSIVEYIAPYYTGIRSQ
jgi:dihydrofolate reductase